MGRRKKAVKKVVKRKKYMVAKVFKCLFCNHDKSVMCKMDSQSMTGELKCTICEAKYQTQINSLSEPIDVFTEWLDETSNLQAEMTKKDVSQSGQFESNEDGNEEDVDDGYESND
mmetsp:Transcript_25185/g.34634  ORF Transcript_25185/g.34634 Transcript_25185/m.34634 type:complete len:115 (-) Transcript_25185:35-379(-)